MARLEEAGHLTRRPHPHDGRSTLVELAPALVRRAAVAFDPLVQDLDRLTAELDPGERIVITRFLERVAALSEHQAERARRLVEAQADGALTAPVPSLWG